MALPSSGSSISLQQTNVELGLTATAAINMGGSAVRGLFGVASGAIDMSDGFGKSSAYDAQYLVIAGGAGGGTHNGRATGGGGAGGFLTATGFELTGGTEYTVTVGAGGAAGANGANSVFSSITSTGGGAGGTTGGNGAAGGSGGGAGGFSSASGGAASRKQ